MIFFFFKIWSTVYRRKNERPWMFLDFRQNNNNAGSHRGADARSRGVGNTIISPTLHIPSLTFPGLLYHNRTHWLEIIPILVNFSFVPLAISRLSSQKKVRCLIIPDWTLPSAHSAILQLPENWQLATNHKDIIMQKSDKIAEDRVKRSPLVCDVRSVNYCWAENQAQLTITLLAPVLTKTQEVDSTC